MVYTYTHIYIYEHRKRVAFSFLLLGLRVRTTPLRRRPAMAQLSKGLGFRLLEVRVQGSGSYVARLSLHTDRFGARKLGPSLDGYIGHA